MDGKGRARARRRAAWARKWRSASPIMVRAFPTEVAARMFEPFFTTKAQGVGTGLGLHIAHNIVVNRHRGRIDFDSRPGRTEFRIVLPLPPDWPQAPAPVGRKAASRGAVRCREGRQLLARGRNRRRPPQLRPTACPECVALGDEWVHLRICLVCGHVGCCDNSKNRHARRHFRDTRTRSSSRTSLAKRGDTAYRRRSLASGNAVSLGSVRTGAGWRCEVFALWLARRIEMGFPASFRRRKAVPSRKQQSQG